MKIVLATGNRGKVEELKYILKDLDAQVISLNEFPQVGDIIEDGATFEENAIKKAKAVSDATGLVAVADDSGLEVDFLNGAPGVYSARFAGEDKDDEENNNKLLSLLAGQPPEKRSARFKCVIAVSCPKGQLYTAEGTCEGVIAEDKKGEGGFGYDPLFIVPEYNKTFGELEPHIKNIISHRAKALEKIKPILEDIIKEGRL